MINTAERPTGLMFAGLLCLLAGGAASAEVWAQGRKSKSAQYHTQDSQSGAYQYGYTGPHHAKSESSFNGVTRGGYSYVDANGLMQTVSYTADAENGFRVQASNLPNGNSLVPVQDTPEVAVAKRRHLEQLRQADSWHQQQQQQQRQQMPPLPEIEHVYLNSAEEQYDEIPEYTFRPRQYRPSQYRRQQQQPEMQAKQSSPSSQQQQQQRQLEPQAKQSSEMQQQLQQQQQQQMGGHYQQLRQRARQASNARASFLLTAEEANEIPAAPRPSASNANAIVVEAAKPMPLPSRFSTASATVHQQHLIVPTIMAVPMPLVHSSMRHTQDTLGQYEYSYTGDTSAKTESRSLDGTTRGAYSYIDANGLLQQVHYIADKDGFRVLATNLPH